jgi:predicted RNA methylase
VFDEGASEFADARGRLRELLDDTEWKAAARTTLNAHYTDFDVATAMWTAVVAAGFGGGRVLEPGVGSGTFLATCPDSLAVEAVGVEVDPVTARIAKTLHPDATIRSESFAVTRYPDGWFDLTVGNVPFGDTSCSTRSTTRPATRFTTISSPRASGSPGPADTSPS